ncbi:HpcH/HpaI aldolase/citrate lyase family protein [Dermatophilus congolensis]|uniref:HpcH/HpaI aldolase/citrate lyase family protein n=1 Tax=Dermatophilus congolensis TaxID=1863 RepID=UPI001AAE563C|nr:CoA ester lyase [Dermatophilus congolensis]MBO3143098.1 CoA ester lyase [Dermatophilus congolensis]MBO3152084.1 CoA ester lyase [Dermatophilus congolensis]MBO3160903.1 CoA ester lyase [Dermatophilus congolensis]MBO3163372.1 CoA ester lyase [Dermatophilus congolensis]MBO3176922.1 CoA ester lyase [Dermatophilus congolensis]
MATTPDPTLRPRRSVLYMPASNPRALEKATTLPCDSIIFDLEDAVAPENKPAAREAACAATQSGKYGHRELIIRVNAINTPWHHDDIAAAAAAAPDAIAIPKINTAEEIHAICAALEAAHAQPTTAIWAMCETPLGVLNAPSIATASPRLHALVMGSNDLIKELHAEDIPGRAPLMAAMSWAVLAARAAKIAILDAVHNNIHDHDGFVTEATMARQMGFDGKTLIHPNHIAAANEIFSPTPAHIEQAHAIIDAWDAADGAGIATYNGRMIEQLHVDAARRTLTLAEAITALENDTTP